MKFLFLIVVVLIRFCDLSWCSNAVVSELNPEKISIKSSIDFKDAAARMCESFYNNMVDITYYCCNTFFPVEKAFNQLQPLLVVDSEEVDEQVLFKEIMKEFVGLMFVKCKDYLYAKVSVENHSSFAIRLIFFLYDCLINEIEVPQVYTFCFLQYISIHGRFCGRYANVFELFYDKLSDSYKPKLLAKILDNFNPRYNTIPTITICLNGDIKKIEETVKLFGIWFEKAHNPAKTLISQTNLPFLFFSILNSDYAEYCSKIILNILDIIRLSYLIRVSLGLHTKFSRFIEKLDVEDKEKDREVFVRLCSQIVSDSNVTEIEETSVLSFGLILEPLFKKDEALMNLLANKLSRRNKIKFNAAKSAGIEYRASSARPVLALSTITSDISSNDETVLLKLDSDLISISAYLDTRQKHFFDDNLMEFEKMDKSILAFLSRDSYPELSPELSLIRFRCLVKCCDIMFKFSVTHMFTYKYMIKLMKYFLIHVNPFHHDQGLDLNFEFVSLKKFVKQFITAKKFWLSTSDWRVILEYLRLTTDNVETRFISIIIDTISSLDYDPLAIQRNFNTIHQLGIYHPTNFSLVFTVYISKFIVKHHESSKEDKIKYINTHIDPVYKLYTDNNLLTKTEQEVYNSLKNLIK